MFEDEDDDVEDEDKDDDEDEDDTPDEVRWWWCGGALGPSRFLTKHKKIFTFFKPNKVNTKRYLAHGFWNF